MSCRCPYSRLATHGKGTYGKATYGKGTVHCTVALTKHTKSGCDAVKSMEACFDALQVMAFYKRQSAATFDVSKCHSSKTCCSGKVSVLCR